MELCTRVPPPPIPPWFLDGTKEFRNLVANCSSWTRYAESCPTQVPSEYVQATIDVGGTGSAVNQWIAVIITSLLVICIVICVCIFYFLYRTNRMTIDFLDDCHKSVCQSHISKNKRYIALSASEITQLAMEEDNLYMMTSPQVTIHELVKRRLKTGRKSSPSALSLPFPSPVHRSGEIMLLPETLMVENRQSPLYSASLSESEYCSSHSLPTDSDCQKLATSIKQQSETSSLGLDDDQYDNSVIHTGKVKAHQKNNSLYTQLWKHGGLKISGYKTMAEARKVVQRCKKAGVSLIDSAHFWHTDRLSPRQTFVKLRQSINKIHTPRQQFQATFKNTEMCKSTDGSYPTTSSEI